jgi:hypothetical protein
MKDLSSFWLLYLTRSMLLCRPGFGGGVLIGIGG